MAQGLWLLFAGLLACAPVHAGDATPKDMTPAPQLASPKSPAAALPAGARSITLPEADIRAALGKRFPLTRNLKGLLSLQISQPDVQLRPELNRLQTRLNLQVSEPFTGRSHAGSAELLHRLRYQETDHSLRLSDIEVTTLDFPQLPEPYRSLLRQHAPALLAQTLPELPLYNAQASETALIDGLGFRIGTIDITPKGLRVALLPPDSRPASGQ